MGPCQGGFCTFRAAGILHEMAVTRPVRSGHAGAAERRATASGTSPICSRRHSHNGGSQPAGTHATPRRWPAARISPNLLLRDFLQAALARPDAHSLGAAAQAGAAGRTDLPEPDERDHLPDDTPTEQSPLTEFWQFDTTPK